MWVKNENFAQFKLNWALLRYNTAMIYKIYWGKQDKKRDQYLAFISETMYNRQEFNYKYIKYKCEKFTEKFTENEQRY